MFRKAWSHAYHWQITQSIKTIYEVIQYLVSNYIVDILIYFCKNPSKCLVRHFNLLSSIDAQSTYFQNSFLQPTWKLTPCIVCLRAMFLSSLHALWINSLQKFSSVTERFETLLQYIYGGALSVLCCMRIRLARPLYYFQKQ